MTPTASLQDLMVKDLKEIYSAENQTLKTYPKLVQAVRHPELKVAMQQHLEQTQHQVERLESIFDRMGQQGSAETSVVMTDLIREAEDLLQHDERTDEKDSALLVAAQKIAHYEIAGYGTIITYAEQLGNTDLAETLKQTLHEEKQTDMILSRLAEEVKFPVIAEHVPRECLVSTNW